MSNKEIYILSCCRTPIGTFGGSLKNVRAYQLGALVLKEAVKRAGIDKKNIDEVILGDCIQVCDEANTSRTAALEAGIPFEIPAYTIQRQCGSGMQTVISSCQEIKAGDASVLLAGGVESMSNAPYLIKSARWGLKLRNSEIIDSAWEILYAGSRMLGEPYLMGMTAENLASKYNITREEQDELALLSQRRAIAAIRSGRFKDEIVPVPVNVNKKDIFFFDTDEHPRDNISMQTLAVLKPVFKEGGTVTAGNSSGLNDGAAALVIAGSADSGMAKPMARIIDYAVAGVDPRYMGYGPIPAIQKLMGKTGLQLEQIDLIELNEAFAAQYIVCEKLLGLDREKVNVNGSGISLGHPVGCTGARIIVSLVYEMKKRNSRYGIAGLCIGGGMGAAMLIENI